MKMFNANAKHTLLQLLNSQLYTETKCRYKETSNQGETLSLLHDALWNRLKFAVHIKTSLNRLYTAEK